MIRLAQTCGACPEQYDAYDEEGKIVGYLRLRYGYFSVECPRPGGLQVYSAEPDGDGMFEPDERDYYLRFAVAAIERWLRGEHPARPPAPDVEYTIA